MLPLSLFGLVAAQPFVIAWDYAQGKTADSVRLVFLAIEVSAMALIVARVIQIYRRSQPHHRPARRSLPRQRN